MRLVFAAACTCSGEGILMSLVYIRNHGVFKAVTEDIFVAV